VKRRTVLITGAAAAVALVAGVSVVYAGSGSGTATAEDATGTGTAEVVRRTLLAQEELDGTLGYGDAVPVVNRAAGTVTWLAAEGTLVDRGQALYELDGRQVPLLFGDRPAWRPLGEGSAAGPDIRQLEENLVALGHASAKNLDVDDTWTAATTAAVKRWQKARGVTETGALALGDAVFLPSAVKVASHSATLGTDAPPGGEVLKATPATQVVSVDLDAGRAGLLETGDAVEVELPDERRIPATVTAVATVATSADNGMGGGGDPTLEVVVTPDASAGDLDGSPVTVLVTRDRAEDVLAVPVHALLALAEGGYAVELADGGRLVAVETGLFSGGFVQVTGAGLEPGTRVVVPA
jgi:peptidoglycan hydrolase-like protein with peptidoglycan-binding domain